MLLQRNTTQDCQAGTLLLLLCGLPGAGKTTLAAQLLAHACTLEQPLAAHHICFDELGCGVEPSTFSPAAWKHARKHALAAVAKALVAAGAEGAGSSGSSRSTRVLVIVDDNSHLRSMREEAYSLARKHGAAYTALHLCCPPTLAAERNEARPPRKRVPPEALARMAACFETPGVPTAPPWDRDAIVVDAGNSIDVGALWRQVWNTWGPPEPRPFDAAAATAAKAAAQQATAASLAHAVDLACRQAISDMMQRLAGAHKERRAAMANLLNKERQAILIELRQHLGAEADLEDMVQIWSTAFQQRVAACMQDAG